METEEHLSREMRAASLSSTSTLSLPGLDLGDIPPIAILSAHMKEDEEKSLKETLQKYNAPLTTDFSCAKVFIGKVSTKRRAEFELRSRKFVVEDAVAFKRRASPIEGIDPRSNKRTVAGVMPLRITSNDKNSTTEDESAEDSETEDEETKSQDYLFLPPVQPDDTVPLAPFVQSDPTNDIIWIIKTNWIEACALAGHPVSLVDNVVYTAKVLKRPKSIHAKSLKDIFAQVAKRTTVSQTTLAARPHTAQEILDRAKSDAPASKPKYQPYQSEKRHGSRRFEGKSYATSSKPGSHPSASHIARLQHRTTSEYESDDSDLPQLPEWVRKGAKYACQRYTPANGPNEDFLEQLRKIRTARTLIDDKIGIRAYSTIIASIAAYPYKLIHPREIARLPGCDEKSASLFVEWSNTGKIQAVEDYENDEAMKVLRSFYDIWGVGAKTARQFYYQNHWTELDDIIEFGWNDLDRVQQIGLKYYDEFLIPIPRAEVEQIASVVRQRAIHLRDERITVTIVGGYRRGKQASGDVDMIVSHPNLNATAGLVREIVETLEDAEWITHTLTMNLTNTHREQQTLPFRSARGTGVGFDTLDKALVVWQDPDWPTRESDIAENPEAKNPNIHHRVDIIVAPWRTVGCAVMGWSGGTTFQRDLRRYAKYIKGWKFDSSGIRSRSNGEPIRLEGPDGVDGSPEDAEKVVFKGMGLEFIPPECRVTY